VSSHTTYFCDVCNQDLDNEGDRDGRSAVCNESPGWCGWATFNVPVTGSTGFRYTDEVHVCAHCLADPEFEDREWGEIHGYDFESRQNLVAGRQHAAIFEAAQESIGTKTRWGWTGVRQKFERYWNLGPRLDDGRFNSTDRVYVRAGAKEAPDA
jgi:hypothetical protein